MWEESKIIEYLNRELKEKRYEHSLNVRDTAKLLAEIYDADKEKAVLAGLVHDAAKYLNNDTMIEYATKYGYNVDEIAHDNPSLLHGAAGAYIAKNVFKIEDKEILEAVVYHTTGKRNMSKLEKIIYIADYIEPSRDFPGVEALRKITFENLDKGVLLGFDITIKHIIDKGGCLHHDTIDGRNYLLKNK
ncbi:bis(5'-nucleosyl)-tetraphosphatase (symmetrical) YqeK [Clostridium sp. DL1XJH146]